MSGPSVYWRRASTSTSTPGQVRAPDSAIRRAVFSSTSPAIRTRSKRRSRVAVDRGVDRRRDVMSSSAASRATTVGRWSSGRSDGRSLTTNVGDVGHQRPAVPVVDEAARGDRRVDRRAVVRGQGREPVRRRRSGGRTGAPSGRSIADHDDQRERQEPRDRPDGLRAVVEEDGHQSTRSASTRRSWIETTSGPIKAARIVS